MKGCMHVEAGAGMRSVVHVCTGWGEKGMHVKQDALAELMHIPIP